MISNVLQLADFLCCHPYRVDLASDTLMSIFHNGYTHLYNTWILHRWTQQFQHYLMVPLHKSMVRGLCTCTSISNCCLGSWVTVVYQPISSPKHKYKQSLKPNELNLKNVQEVHGYEPGAAGWQYVTIPTELLRSCLSIYFCNF